MRDIKINLGLIVCCMNFVVYSCLSLLFIHPVGRKKHIIAIVMYSNM